MTRAAVATLAFVLLLLNVAASRAPVDLQVVPVGSSSAVSVSLCKVCGVFVSAVDHVLGDDKVKTWLIQYVEDQLCPKLPSDDLQEECVEEAPKFVPEVVNWAEGVANTALCTDAGICSTEGLNEDYSIGILTSNASSEACSTCRNFALLVEAEITKIKPEDVEKKMEELKQACNELGSESIQKQCKHMVEKYGAILIFFLEKEQKSGDIEKACTYLGICPQMFLEDVIEPYLAHLVQLVARMPDKRLGGQTPCQKCKIFGTIIQYELLNRHTREEVVDYMSGLCKWMLPVKENCKETVGNYTEIFLSDVAAATNPEKMCDELGVCSPPVQYKVSVSLAASNNAHTFDVQ